MSAENSIVPTQKTTKKSKDIKTLVLPSDYLQSAGRFFEVRYEIVRGLMAVETKLTKLKAWPARRGQVVL